MSASFSLHVALQRTWGFSRIQGKEGRLCTCHCMTRSPAMTTSHAPAMSLAIFESCLRKELKWVHGGLCVKRNNLVYFVCINCQCWVLQRKTDLNHMQSTLPWGQQTLCSPERSQVLRSHWMSGTPRSLLMSTVTYVHSSWSMQLPTLFVPEHKSSKTGFWHTALPVTKSCLQKRGQSVDVYNNHVLNKANPHLNLLLTLLYLSCKGTSAAKSICCAAQLILRKQVCVLHSLNMLLPVL